MRPAAAGFFASCAGVAWYTLAMIGGGAPSRKTSMRLRVATNEAARTGAELVLTSSTLCGRSFGELKQPALPVQDLLEFVRQAL